MFGPNHQRRDPGGREGRWGPMGTTCGRYCRLAIAFAFALMCVAAPAQANANPNFTVFPGMQIYQGNTACMVGFVETRLRIALSTGQCDDGSLVTDRDNHLLGTVVVARRQSDDAAGDSAPLAVEYEVIALGAEVTASDLLPTGRHLESTPALRAQQGLPVCQLRTSGGKKCGSVGPISDGRFTIADLAVDHRDFGGPVYALTDDNRRLVVGLSEGMWKSAPTLESWQAVMEQLYIDNRARGEHQLPTEVRMIGR